MENIYNKVLDLINYQGMEEIQVFSDRIIFTIDTINYFTKHYPLSTKIANDIQYNGVEGFNHYVKIEIKKHHYKITPRKNGEDKKTRIERSEIFIINLFLSVVQSQVAGQCDKMELRIIDRQQEALKEKVYYAEQDRVDSMSRDIFKAKEKTLNDNPDNQTKLIKQDYLLLKENKN